MGLSLHCVGQQAQSVRAEVQPGHLLCFTGSVSDDLRADVRCATALARTIADDTSDRFVAPEYWYHAYVRALTGFGWSGTDLSFRSHVSEWDIVRLDDVVRDSLGAVAAGDEVAAAATALQRLRSCGDASEPMSIWNSRVLKDDLGHVHIATVSLLPSGDLVMAVVALQISMPSPKQEFMWLDWQRDRVGIRRAMGVFTLKSHAFAMSHQAVIARSNDNPSLMVAEIPIG
ncbi:MAG: hypothetical protein AAF376_03320 [Pseudomonadota bacterium]